MFNKTNSGSARVPNQNGVSLLHFILEIHHSGPGDTPFWSGTLNCFDGNLGLRDTAECM